MRIISGKFKGKKISLPDDKKTRPLKDIVKESIFNLINHSKKINTKVENANILDLFSGSGSFGIECLSRGSESVFFVENFKEALIILKKNISELKYDKKSNIIEMDCYNYLKSIDTNKGLFDIIFCDPPYKETKVKELMDIIKEKKILKKNGVIIFHRHKKDNVDFIKKTDILDVRFYGISQIVISR